ncbi:MAG: TIGR03790 family protein [Phycisphaerae bacterium]
MLVRSTRRLRRRTWVACVCAVVAVWPGAARAGGGPENALIIIDPQSVDSQYVGHYYQHARHIPDRNVIYMNPAAANYAAHMAFQLPALFGMLSQRGVEDHIDYIVIPPGSGYRMAAPGLVSDSCASVESFSISAAYGMAFLADEIVAGVPSTLANEYFGGDNNANAFDSNILWHGGSPGGGGQARRYFIGAMLGYSGERGNTVEDTIAMIDRSVAADGTRSGGTFYYMKTTDPLRSGPRDPHFPGAVATILDLGGDAVVIEDVLPTGHHDCLGIMTGWAEPDIIGADMTIAPGALCDHLTSFAAAFDTSAQTKVSAWIAKGASGSVGAVEEPCNYAGKFPHPRMHVYYYQGLSLGEAAFRSLAYVPFQMLIYGDPLTRPFAYLPEVTVPDWPTGTVAGSLVLTPAATTQHPTADIAQFDLYVDGVVAATAPAGSPLTVDTTDWPDGPHDVRVVAYDDTRPKSQGRWAGTITTDNRGLSVTLTPDATSGDMGSVFGFEVAGSGGAVREIRVVCSGRVVAATGQAIDTITLPGSGIGPGPVHVRAVAEFADGRLAMSEEHVVTIAPTGVPPGDAGPTAPVAYGYLADVQVPEPMLVALPASDLDGSSLVFTVVSAPAQAAVEGSGPMRLITPAPDATGCDTLTFTAGDGAQTSPPATITLRYRTGVGDADGDGDVDVADAAMLQGCFTGDDPTATPTAACLAAFDVNCDGDVDRADFACFVASLTGPG